MENTEVAQIFEEVADLLEIKGENPFRVRAYRNAARTVRDLSEPAAHIVSDHPESLTQLPGIGTDLAGKITTIVRTGDLPLRRQLCKQVPAGFARVDDRPWLWSETCPASAPRIGGSHRRPASGSCLKACDSQAQGAKVLIERWRQGYNTIRPHSLLGYRPPAPEAIQSWSAAGA